MASQNCKQVQYYMDYNNDIQVQYNPIVFTG